MNKEEAIKELLLAAHNRKENVRVNLNKLVGNVLYSWPPNNILDLYHSGFFSGMLSDNEGSQFLHRLNVNRSEKINIVDYIINDKHLGEMLDKWIAGRDIAKRRIFFESGSTIAFLIGAIALIASAKREEGLPAIPINVSTNNHVAVTALAGLVNSILQIRGELSLKYFGSLPFELREPKKPQEISREIDRLESLVQQTKRCDDIYGTCSNFSFFAGPLVGEWKNAMVKRAIHEVMVDDNKKHRFMLLLQFQKIIGLSPVPSGIQMQAPKERCEIVFPKRQIIDLTEVKSNSVNWHTDYFAGKKDDKVAISILASCAESDGRQISNLDTEASWLDRCINVEIVIGLPDDQTRAAMQWLRDEIETVNNLIALTGVQYDFVYDPTQASKEYAVAVICAKRVESLSLSSRRNTV